MGINKVNGHRYIGITTKTVRERATGHMRHAKFGSEIKFHKAIRQYGVDNFDFYAIETCASYPLAKEREMFYIEQMRPEYNQTKGGNGAWIEGRQPSERAMEALRKRNEANRGNPNASGMLGKHHTAETIEKIRATKRSRPPVRPWLGKSRSADTKAKISKTKLAKGQSIRQRKAHSARIKAVLRVPDGLAFPNLVAAAKHYGVAKKTILSACYKETYLKKEFILVEENLENWL